MSVFRKKNIEYVFLFLSSASVFLRLFFKRSIVPDGGEVQIEGSLVEVEPRVPLFRHPPPPSELHQRRRTLQQQKQ